MCLWEMVRLLCPHCNSYLETKGLGGTSLLNANVFIPADARTLQLPTWPKEIRNDPNTLDPCKHLPIVQ
jgi:hypothetical protein